MKFRDSHISTVFRVWGMPGCLSKVKDKLVHLVLSTAKKEAQCLIDLFGFWVQQIPHLGILLESIY